MESAALIVPRSPPDKKTMSCNGRRVYFAMLNVKSHQAMPGNYHGANLDLYAFFGNSVMDSSAVPAAQENHGSVFKFNKAMVAKPVASYHHCQLRAFTVCSGSEFYCFGGYGDRFDFINIKSYWSSL